MSSAQIWGFWGLLLAFSIHNYPIRGELALFLELALLVLGYFQSNEHSIPGGLLSIFGYRLSPFHPLAKIPGPIINKITSLRLAYIVYSGKRHVILGELHRRYGKIVRTGPGTISVNSHAAVGRLYADALAMDKSSAYMAKTVGKGGLFFMQSREKHRERRKIWSNAFTPRMLKLYKTAVERRTMQLVATIRRRKDSQGVVNLLECIQHWSYDVMGDITFGGSTNLELMANGDTQDLVRCGQVGTTIFEVLGEVPSLFDILWHLPVTEGFKRLENHARRLILSRKTSEIQEDLAGHLLHSGELTDRDLAMDSVLAIVAGSDTTSGIAAFMLYFLVCHPHAYKALVEELDGVFMDSDQPLFDELLEKLPYLEAVVYESLRLGSPLPGLPRVVPKGGLLIEGTYVPEGTIVGVPPHQQHTSEENFSPDPQAFRPERWLPGASDAGWHTNRAALMSFSYGPFGCLGRAVAIQELRVLAARLLLTFDLSPAPGFDQAAFLDGVVNFRTTIFRYPLSVLVKERTDFKE
ncbi:cytochrome P450 [Heliocybe sulcata]|uniref:Cytochrome P450 n=1 Tax=Heliocybe sulcata TaxID=5364 RepID=A0A5C3MMK8_9AGAM|nr:cytochrome P450 [Heliocybe sulcata]